DWARGSWTVSVVPISGVDEQWMVPP
ncbi:MAG: hypothetical protein RL215_2854, partial [Planctomycetota bacterium]